MTTTIPVAGGAFAPYEVVVGRGLLKTAGAEVAALKPTRAFIVSDKTVAAIHGETVRSSLEGAGLATGIVTVPAGEASKSFEQLEAVLDRLLTEGLDRKSLVVALGGGVVPAGS